MFSLFQIMTLEGWADIAREIMPRHPYAWLFFIVFILLATFTVLNLFIAIIVNAMQAQHEGAAARDGAQAAASGTDAPSPAAGDIAAQLAALRTEIGGLRQLLREAPAAPRRRRVSLLGRPPRNPAQGERLVLVLGDQLDRDSAAFDGFDAARDRIWMAEVAHESRRVPSHKARSALFLSAMRHFRDELRARGWTVEYRELGADPEDTLEAALAADLARLRPAALRLVQPGEHRLATALATVADEAGVPFELAPDRHFMCTPEDFAGWARGRKELRLEYFYRWLRRREGVLMDGAAPAGGEWNFDIANRGAFGKDGPPRRPAPRRFPPDALTRNVIELVERAFPGNPGRTDQFDWPVTPADAEAALVDFVEHRLAGFGRYQDAMWAGEPWLYHSRLSAALNLKLIRPARVVQAAEEAFRAGRAPIEAVEGFVRQVLGWREFVRGVYWLHMPRYAGLNALEADAPLPRFYWDGETELNCLREAVGQTLQLGHAHHIQRLMVTGLFALLLGVQPHESPRVVPCRLRRRGRVGRAAEHARHVAVCRRRHRRLQALRRLGQVHRAHEQLLRGMSLSSRRGPRTAGMPVHDALLGFPCAPSRALCESPAHRAAGTQSRSLARRGAGLNPSPGRRLAPATRRLSHAMPTRPEAA